MQFLKHNAAATIMLGPFVSKTDGVALLTDATTITDIDHATTGIFLSKAGGVAAVRHQSVTASVADAYGMMKVTLDTTDTNAIGMLDVLFAKAATYLPVHKQFMVLPASVYDAWVEHPVHDFSGMEFDPRVPAAGFDTMNPAMSADAFDRLGTPSGGSVSDDILTLLGRLVGTIATGTHNPQTGDAFARLGAPAGASIAADLVVIDNFVDDLETRITEARLSELDAGTPGKLAAVADVIAVDVAGLDGAAMRGTDSAALASVCTEARLSELDAASAGKMAYVADVIAVDVAGLDGAAMRGTDSAALASVCTETRLAELDAANLPTDIAARATPAQVNAEVLDVLNVDTFAEPGQGAPAATTTLAAKINYLFKFLRNRITQTATTLSVYDDAGTTVDQKATISDDATTYDRGEIVGGP